MVMLKSLSLEPPNGQIQKQRRKRKCFGFSSNWISFYWWREQRLIQVILNFCWSTVIEQSNLARENASLGSSLPRKENTRGRVVSRILIN